MSAEAKNGREMKVLVTVEGGVVTSVMCNDAEAEVRVLDWDNLKAGRDVQDGQEIVPPEKLAEEFTTWAKSNQLVEVL